MVALTPGPAVAGQVRTAMASPAYVKVAATGPAGEDVGLEKTFYRGDLVRFQDTSGYYSTLDSSGGESDDPGELIGTSLRGLISRFGVDPLAVVSVDIRIDAPGGATLAHLTSATGDLSDPAHGTIPFKNQSPPVLATNLNPLDSGFELAVAIRNPPAAIGVTNGKAYPISDGSGVVVSLALSTLLLMPTVTAPQAADLDSTISLTGVVDGPDPGTLAWRWTFDDDTPPADGASVQHRFTTPGRHLIVADVTGNGASGREEVTVFVPPATTAPHPTPPADETGGAGGSTAPNVGPIEGSGARVGGVPTDRPGGGRAGATYDPRSATPSASGSASGSPAPGGLVGYVLSDPDRPPAQQAQAASTPLDDSAPALRAGRTVRHVGAWLLATAAVVALLLVGAGSERRRPSHTRARRRPTRRAP